MENFSSRTMKMFENLKKQETISLKSEEKESRTCNIPRNAIILDIPEITDNLEMSSCNILDLETSCHINTDLNLATDGIVMHSDNGDMENPTVEQESTNHSDVINGPDCLNNYAIIEDTWEGNFQEFDGSCSFDNIVEPKIITENRKEVDVRIFEDIEQNSSEKERDYFSESSSNFEEAEQKKVKRNKRRKVDQTKWTVNVNKSKRERGENYFGKRKERGAWNYQIEKGKRVLKEWCNCKISQKSSSLQCNMLDEKERGNLFNFFWTKLNWGQRKVFVNSLVQKIETKRIRNRKDENVSRRNFSWIYHLKLKYDVKFRVCKKMFINTLGIGERSVIEWKNASAKQFDIEIDQEAMNIRTLNEKSVSTRLNLLREFLRDLPKIESHYCRAQSSKLYLEPNWDSKSGLYRFYKLWSNCRDVKPLSQKVFDLTFADMNLRTACMDMQAVLLSPKSNVSSLYFKMKLMVHNFTIYDVKTNDGCCFIWHEGAGGVTSNEYTSIVSHFFMKNVLKNMETGQKIILYSDGCTSQNRNSTLSSALLNIAKQFKIVIEQKYLEKGHTQMTADSMHSLIERKLKSTTINVPADYISVCLNARRNPRPYKVQYLGFDFFKDFGKVKLLNSIRPGYKIGDPVVTDLRCLRYNPNGELQYTLKHTDEFTNLVQRRPSKITDNVNFMNLPQLYKSSLPIEKEKWEHLQSLKSSIPEDFHAFYDGLCYK